MNRFHQSIGDHRGALKADARKLELDYLRAENPSTCCLTPCSSFLELAVFDLIVF